MPRITIFSDQEIRILKQLIDQLRKKRSNVPSRPSQERSYDEAEDHQASDVYIAHIPIGTSLPGLTWVVGQPDRTTPVELDIYRVEPTDNELVKAGQAVEVHNISLTTITGANVPYIVISKDKFGRWVVDCPCGGPPYTPTGTGTGTGTGTATSTSSSTSTSTSSDPAGTVCCDQHPSTLSAEHCMEDVLNPGTCCDTRTISLVKSGNIWSGMMTNWCTSPASFLTEFRCHLGVPELRVDGNAWSSALFNSPCLPATYEFQPAGVSDNVCGCSTPGTLKVTVTT